MLKKAIKILAISLMFVALTVDVFAGGGKRNGTAAAAELLIPVSARGLAMSGAYLAGFEGLDAIYYNPAGLGVTNNSAEAMFSYMNYIADIGFSYAAVAMNFESFGALGFSVRTLDFGDIPVTTVENPYGTGATFSPTYVTLGVTYSNALTDRIRVGVNVNIITEEIMRTSATGFAFDAGIQYNGLAGVEGLKMGVALRNLGPQIKFEGPDLLRFAEETGSKRGQNFYAIQSADFELPSQLELGLAYERRFSDSYKALFATSFQNNNFSHDEYRFAGEFAYNDIFFLRGGYTYVGEAVDDADQYIWGPSFGAGVKLESALNITVDYAFRAVTYFDANHMITVTLGF
ncbi:MAG: PorV/PorQ family protein [Melioribacteraceae bacterium]|nr:PorV/PorQ family protein [Melioribacteraceae bacterium]MCF8393851.1 PorV/PorQ family protein [Melioribacteraceae bacterium]MCF8418224.1 PorV/PorQ family protein [Melioribacteraceae bacterium]